MHSTTEDIVSVLRNPDCAKCPLRLSMVEDYEHNMEKVTPP